MKLLIPTTLLLLAILASNNTFANSKPLALVWKNGGTCFPYCASSAGKMAIKAGFKVRYITRHTKNIKKALKIAKVWIQPGGKSKVAANRMGPETMKYLREFVRGGGGYVGFCAGMLLATSKIGSSNIEGLGLLTGKTVHLMNKKKDKPYILDIDLVEHGTRSIYFSGGPYLKNHDKNTYVTGHYSTGEIASVESNFGKGRVIVSGFHPETPTWFKKITLKFDSDGDDFDLAVEMIKRAGAYY